MRAGDGAGAVVNKIDSVTEKQEEEVEKGVSNDQEKMGTGADVMAGCLHERRPSTSRGTARRDRHAAIFTLPIRAGHCKTKNQQAAESNRVFEMYDMQSVHVESLNAVHVLIDPCDHLAWSIGPAVNQ